MLQPWRVSDRSGGNTMMTLPTWVIPIGPFKLAVPSSDTYPNWDQWKGRRFSGSLVPLADKHSWCDEKPRDYDKRCNGSFEVLLKMKPVDFERWYPGVHQLLLYVGTNKTGRPAERRWLKSGGVAKGKGYGR